jgi:hypothetical protein
MNDRTDVVDRVLATPRAVNDLVRHDDGARPVLRLQGAHGAGGQDLSNSDRAQSPEVGAVVDAVGREAVALPVPGQEGDPPTLEIPDDDIVAGVTERGGDGEPFGVGEELVEP